MIRLYSIIIRVFGFIVVFFSGVNCSRGPKPLNDGHGDYVLVPEGEFMMGDNFDEGNADEIPVHTVYLDAYYIGKYKVTNGEYGKFIDDGGYVLSEYWSAGGFGEYGNEPEHWNSMKDRGGGIAGHENYPVVGVSWFEAMAYCRWLSSKTGKNYRLPTEAEWEKAARGTDQRRYAWGNEIDKSYANYDHGQDRNTMSLRPVGFYDGSMRDGFRIKDNASPYGAFDMTGNVSEWCFDWYDMEYYSRSPVENPKGPGSGSSRVLRAGGYVDSAYYQRAAGRHKMGAHFKSYKTGFRCVREY
jgi:formylglycine-generating enzyme required for sulfatase activity